jgi:hypothetical protein
MKTGSKAVVLVPGMDICSVGTAGNPNVQHSYHETFHRCNTAENLDGNSEFWLTLLKCNFITIIALS